ncbi:MAG: hypothetical protein ACOZBH_00110 [Patescibacteria group bacterium]
MPKFEVIKQQPSALDAALDDYRAGDEKSKRFAQNEIIRLFKQDPDLFIGREDEAIKALKGIQGEAVREVLQGLFEGRESRAHEDRDETREMPALKIGPGLDALLKAKMDFREMTHDADELAGFIGALRQMASNRAYLKDVEFVRRFSGSIETIGDAISIWPNMAEKADLERKYNRLYQSLPEQIKSQVMEKVA